MYIYSRADSLMYSRANSLVPRPHHAREERVWGHWCRFLVLQTQQSCDYLHRLVLAHVWSRNGAQDQENTPMSPEAFPLEGGVWERDYRADYLPTWVLLLVGKCHSKHFLDSYRLIGKSNARIPSRS